MVEHTDRQHVQRISNLRFGVRVSVAIATALMSHGVLAQCVAHPSEAVDSDVRSLPLVSISDMSYIGGFALPADTFGGSSMNFAKPIIEKFGSSLFAVGHVNDDAIAEFKVPDLVNSTNVRDLNSSGPPVQNFSSVLGRAASGNGQTLDQINGLEVFDGQLIVNAIEYYDGSGSNSDTTLVFSNGGNLSGSSVKGYHRLQGAARAAGWMTELPPEWQAELGHTHLTGSSSGDPIISRHSVGPSAFAVNARDIVNAPASGSGIGTEMLLEFSQRDPLHADLFNESRQNDLWTHTSKALFGFVVPGTRTYATFGFLSGGESGIGYKITQSNGNLCGGYCARDAGDVYNYYWFWDMNDLLDVKAGTKASHSVRPYAYGKFNVPFQEAGGRHPMAQINPIGGGTFDASENTVYFSVSYANNTLGSSSNPPVIAAYRFPDF